MYLRWVPLTTRKYITREVKWQGIRFYLADADERVVRRSRPGMCIVTIKHWEPGGDAKDHWWLVNYYSSSVLNPRRVGDVVLGPSFPDYLIDGSELLDILSLMLNELTAAYEDLGLSAVYARSSFATLKDAIVKRKEEIGESSTESR